MTSTEPMLYSSADQKRIKIRERAIEHVENEILKLDKRLNKVIKQINIIRREYNAALTKNNKGKRKQNARINLFQNNLLEFQHEIAEIYALKHGLRDELIRRGDDLATLLENIQVRKTYDLDIFDEEPLTGC